LFVEIFLAAAASQVIISNMCSGILPNQELADVSSPEPDERLLSLDDGLNRLALEDPGCPGRATAAFCGSGP